MRGDYEWQDNPPKENGDFFYNGPLPDGGNVITIVQVFTHPENNKRMACTLIPPGWRGDKDRKRPVLHAADLEDWRGQWSGPEYGLCCVVYSGESNGAQR